jgi:hydrogenase maturation protein HypF
VWLVEGEAQDRTGEGETALKRARDLLLAGKILAIKGLGGFHLACDATNAEAVRTLRERKRRPHKPFALMVATLDHARALCEVPPPAVELMTSPQCPIVLLERRPDTLVVDAVAPNSHTLGVMVPYTPLHHVLLRDVGRPLVMTSGNLTEEPIAKDNAEALRRLAPLADAFLLHDRDIHARYDDSVVQIAVGIPQIIRRARGYAPFPLRLPFEMRQTFAAGPQQKNTFTLTRDDFALMSQHIGDLENLDTLRHYESALATYRHLFRLEPEVVVCDLHPDYLSTRFAEEYAEAHGLPTPLRVQHHEAHVAACLVDNGRTLDDGPVIGVAFDGTGYGKDGAIWGGEWFVGTYDGFRRAAHLAYLPLPGGDAAIRHPWRIAVSYLHTLLGPEAFPAGLFCPSEAMMVRQQVQRRLNTPLTSSMGRLFDAVSALFDVCQTTTYEAQAAIELEQVASQGAGRLEPYPFDVDDEDGVHQVRLAPLFDALLRDRERAVPRPAVARRFHATVAAMTVQVCRRLREGNALQTVVLTGGVFQNRLLLAFTVPQLRAAGFEVLLHHQTPCNDGCASLGQAAMAYYRAI